MEGAALSTDWTVVREELLRLAQHRATRRQSWSPSMPCDWSPTAIENPQTGMPFSDESAWDLICDLLRGGQAFEEVQLEKPADTIGYVTTFRFAANSPAIYIKLQLRHGIVWGRSFHIDLRSK
jgi:hypothetical protein